jgi:hypothetical protein
MKRKEPRSRHLIVRLSPEEYVALQERFDGTTYRVFSDYIRDLIQQKPISVKQRNQSLDDFLPIAVELKNELQAIGKNINQAVRKLNSLPGRGDLKESLEYFGAEELALRQKTEEIKYHLVKIYELWSQK